MRLLAHLCGLLLAALTLALPRLAFAYTIQSGFMKSCHERISLPAMEFYLRALSGTASVPLPKDDLWRDATGDLVESLDYDGELAALMSNEGLAFAAVSVLIGLREPDTAGYSISDLNAARRMHGDATSRAQHEHALRAADDEGTAGDTRALQGARAVIADHLDDLVRLMDEPRASQILPTYLYVEHYGRIEVEVWGPAYHLGLALHVLQDSFSHAIRTEDTRHVLHVLNYVDAVHGAIDEGEDGLAHSTALDQCERGENYPSVLAASDRSVALTSAALKMTEGDDGQAVRAGLRDCEAGHLGDMECGWLAYFPECQERVDAGGDLSGTCCSRDTAFCDAPLLPTILATPTRPYLIAPFGCTQGAAPPSGPGRCSLFLCAFATLFVLARRWGRSYPARGALRSRGLSWQILLTSGGLFGASFSEVARAQERYPATAVLRAEAHGAFLTDAPRESMLNISFGPALRGGYRFEGGPRAQWGVLGFVERDAWVVSDYEFRADPGVVNLGLGVELLYFGFLRSAFYVGPSILVFDTALHDEGNVGLFTELHPLGAQFYFWDRLGLTFDPLSVAWVNPTPENGKAPSVGHLQYRTTVGVEWRSVPHR